MDNAKLIVEDKPCHECKGRGLISDGDTEESQEWFTCQSCDGTGREAPAALHED